MHVLRGPEAIQALNIYAEELENQGADGLTKTQTDFLIRTAKLLSQAISETEEPGSNQQKSET